MPILDSPILPTRNLSGALQGMTLLAVEDSRYAGEALRQMAHRSGARLRRADSMAAAENHLRLYRPDVMLVDIGLPDGSGLELISRCMASHDRPPPIVAMSGDPNWREAALAAGAMRFIDKPWPGLQRFQTEILRLLPGRGGGPGPDLPLRPDRLALREDLARAAELLEDLPEADSRSYLAQFLGGIARDTRDSALARAAEEFNRREGGSVAALSQILHLRLGETPRPFR